MYRNNGDPVGALAEVSFDYILKAKFFIGKSDQRLIKLKYCCPGKTKISNRKYTQ